MVYQLYQFIKKAFYINAFLIIKLSVSAVFRFRSTISILTPNQADGIKPSFLLALFTRLQTSSSLKSHHLTSRLTPSGSEATESRRALRRSLKKIKRRYRFWGERSETLILYIFNIYVYYIFSSLASPRVPRVSEVYE